MASNPLVSVIIPTRNRCALLQRALASVQAQTHERWEALVIDDGSEDDTPRMIAALDDPRVCFYASAGASGSGNARWRGAQHARGDYIAYLDSDDYWLARKIERQIEQARACGEAEVVVLGPPLTLRDDELFKVRQPRLRAGQRIADYIYTGANGALQTSGFFIAGDLGRRICFDPDLGVNQDTDYLLRLDAAGARFVYLDEHLHVQDANDRSDRISLNRDRLEESLRWFHAVSGDWSPAARRGYFLVDACVRCANQGRIGLGLGYFMRGLDYRRHPYFVLHQLLRVLGGGDIPRRARRMGRWIGAGRGSPVRSGQ